MLISLSAHYNYEICYKTAHIHKVRSIYGLIYYRKSYTYDLINSITSFKGTYKLGFSVSIYKLVIIKQIHVKTVSANALEYIFLEFPKISPYYCFSYYPLCLYYAIIWTKSLEKLLGYLRCKQWSYWCILVYSECSIRVYWTI